MQSLDQGFKRTNNEDIDAFIKNKARTHNTDYILDHFKVNKEIGYKLFTDILEGEENTLCSHMVNQLCTLSRAPSPFSSLISFAITSFVR